MPVSRPTASSNASVPTKAAAGVSGSAVPSGGKCSNVAATVTDNNNPQRYLLIGVGLLSA